jgi:hypothetical protein
MAPVITTAADRPIDIGHYPYPDPPPQPAPPGTILCIYTHLDLAEEELNCSSRYNCWGFTFIPRRYKISTGSDVDKVLEDNCSPVADGSLQPGDVIRYRKNGATTHTGRVWEVDAMGHATVIRSKWGALGEYLHPPLVASLPSSYGTDLAYFRQHSPLKGVADLWIADSPTDDGEQFSHQPWWTSPDIMVDVPPYDGSGDLNPQFAAVNRIWARIRNRANTNADNVHVKYYWADPSAGLGPADWHPIPSTPGHPNPIGPLSIPPFGNIDAPYVEWTPSAAPAHQCLLAIAYINDNPADSDNPDPLVYTFDIPWENNIAQRNVDIIQANSGSHHSVSIGLKNPFPRIERYVADVRVIMTHTRHLPVLGPERSIGMPALRCRTSNEKAVVIKKVETKYLPLMRGRVRFPFMSLQETLIATGVIREMQLRKPQNLTVDITVPRNARPGSIYYVHVVQESGNQIRGGYTIAVVVNAE